MRLYLFEVAYYEYEICFTALFYFERFFDGNEGSIYKVYTFEDYI